MTVETALTVGHLQDLFYRCKYSELLVRLGEHEAGVGMLGAEMVLIKANALFELHRVAEAKAALRSVSQTRDSFDESYLYALARVSYLDNRIEDARRLFREVHDQTASPRHRFKSVLGIVNTYFPKFDDPTLEGLIRELHSFEPLDRLDERISLAIFFGNYHLAREDSQGYAREFFKKAMALAASQTWTYFITRSLVGLATFYQREHRNTEMLWTLEMLQSFVDESEQHFQSFLINRQFGAYMSIDTPIEFDPSNKRILINDRWLAFHDRPLLFEFLMLLHDSQRFVEKRAIAGHLWPSEPYKARVHDPRIFDIAKRTRALIETYEDQPVVLLSGRNGYKLAST
jgi:hypothetical protein